MAVGLAMVNFNGSDVLKMTLDSLLRARVKTPFVVCLIENGSEQKEKEKAIKAFNVFKTSHVSSIPDILILSDENLGFCGGSNLATKKLLENSEIERVCLLNTDVIVTDGWLDRLMESESDIVGPVTNANGNEQTVIIDYQAKQDENVFGLANEFAQFRGEIYSGYEVSSECVTGFCSLIKRDTFEKVGFMDERFYPGGFDDCDYDRRVVAAGGKITIRRDCYLHHWGGGSFSKLAMSKRVGISLANMNRYEEKWQIEWKGTQRLLPESLLQDLEFLSNHHISNKRAWKLIRETAHGLGSILQNYEVARIESDKIHYQQSIEEQYRFEEVKPEKPIQVETVPYVPDPGMRKVAVDIKKAVQTSYHALRATDRQKRTLRKVIDFIQTGKKEKKGTIAILAPFWREDNIKDGYFQRIFTVDQNVLADYKKLYFEYDPTRVFSIEEVDAEHMVIHFPGPDPELANCLSMLMKKCGIVYSHSLLPFVNSQLPSKLLHWLTSDHVKLVVDMHGAVPEEAALYDDWHGAQYYNTMEEILMQGANVIICVNHAMLEHFQKKYSYFDIKPHPIIMPIFPDISFDYKIIDEKLKKSDYKKPVVVYAGGLQRWQNIEMMQDIISKTGDKYRYDMVVNNPVLFRKEYGKRALPGEITVHALKPEEMGSAYVNSHFGFILRDDIAVNNVACPTKLIEYLCYGILPVMKTTQIGDFVRLGMEYITAEDLEQGNIPSMNEYLAKIRHNGKLIASFQDDFLKGKRELLRYIEGRQQDE